MRTVILAAACAFAACGPSVGVGGHDVGGFCMMDADCRIRCLTDSHFPNGMCTADCSSDSDCAAGAACVDEEGGICAVQCGLLQGNCSQLGSGYTAQTVKRKADGAADACICQHP